MSDLQTFINTIPDKIAHNRVLREIENLNLSYNLEVGLRAWAQHDALHYLSNQPFTVEGEQKVAWMEYKFKRGWYILYYNDLTFAEELSMPYNIQQDFIDPSDRVIEDHQRNSTQGNFKILPCPFCGGTNFGITCDVEDREGTPTQITCNDCGCSGPWVYLNTGEPSKQPIEVISQLTGWNKRI